MHTTTELETPHGTLPVRGLLPLHIEYATTIHGATELPSAVTYDREQQISLVNGVPFSETAQLAQMGITSSSVRTDGTKNAVDTGQPDDATPNA